MRLSIGSIKALELVRKEIAELRDYEKSISATQIPETVGIRELYGIYLDIITEKGADMRQTMTLRKNFIFIYVWLYAPGVLLGDRMPRGLRGNLMELLGISAPSAISNNFSEALSYFRNHRRVRQELTEIANKTLRRACSRQNT